MPEPVIATAEAVQIPDEFMPREALRRYHSDDDGERDGMSPQQWRNAVILVRMGAADARYQEFRINLSQEVRGANFGLESAVLGLSGIATVSGEATANALAAAVAALTGARAALNREVYFERTLPALIAGMEVSRLEIATRILSGLGRPTTEYPLEVGLLDALAYERAASLDQAIQVVTAEAAREASEARQIYSNVARRAGIVPEEALPTTDLIGVNLDALAGRAADNDADADRAIGLIMTRLGLPRSGTLDTQIADIASAVSRMSANEMTAFVVAMRGQGVELGQPVSGGE